MRFRIPYARRIERDQEPGMNRTRRSVACIMQVPATNSSAPHRTPPGFRFSVTDGVAIVVCGALVWVIGDRVGPLRWLPVYVLGHFFLFCNVVRMRRTYELIWAAAFVAWFVSQTLGSAVFVPSLALGPPLLLTALLVALELRSPRYHGVGWRVVNPDAGP